jgi:hypothetical protein
MIRKPGGKPIRPEMGESLGNVRGQTALLRAQPGLILVISTGYYLILYFNNNI